MRHRKETDTLSSLFHCTGVSVHMKIVAIVVFILALFCVISWVAWRLGVAWTVRQLRSGRRGPSTREDNIRGGGEAERA